MPVMTNFENEFSKSMSMTNSQAAYLSVSNNLNYQEIYAEPSEKFSTSEKSGKSADIVSASKEFNKIFINTQDKVENLLQREFKIFVWTRNRKLLRDVFPSRCFCEIFELNGQSFEVNFLVYTTKAPIVTDCVVYLVEKKEDFKEVYRVNQLYKHVWIQLALMQTVHKDLEELANAFGIQIVRNPRQLVSKIFDEDFKLVSMIKDLFNKLDENHSGVLEFDSLLNGMMKIRDDITAEEVREGLRRIDLHRNGKVSFEEFLFWWKKGRQGPLSFADSVINWARAIVTNPGTKVMLRTMTTTRMMVNKESRRKEIKIRIGQEVQEGQDLNEILIEIGKGTFRERTLAEINKELQIYCQEIWVDFCFSLKSGILKNGVEAFVKKNVSGFIEEIFGDYIDGKRIKKAININTSIINSTFHLYLILDTSDDYLDPLNKFLLSLDEILSYPTDDNIRVNLKTNESLSKIFHADHLLKVLGSNSSLFITLENWSKMLSLLLTFLPSLTKYPFLCTLLASKGKLDSSFQNPSSFITSLKNLVPNLPSLKSFLSEGVLNLLSQISSKFEDDFSIIGRCGSIGGRINVHCPGLMHNLVING